MNNLQSLIVKTKTNWHSTTGYVFFIYLLAMISACEKNTSDPKPDILRQPNDVSIQVGETATFAVGVHSTTPYTYQWYKESTPIVGATDSTYTTPITTEIDNGTSYKVTIANKESVITSKTAMLTVMQGALSVITFTTEGPSFAPLIEVEGNATILWTWADGSTSNSATPNKSFGTIGTRLNTLLVTPWSAVITINIGYDAEDGGSNSIPKVANQQVSLVEGLQNVASNLKTWCSSYNMITSLDFSNFINLQTIECLNTEILANVNLTNTPLLRRACFEHCKLKSLDLSQSPLIEDLRGAVNDFTTINFGTIGSYFRHICVRDNKQVTNESLFSDLKQFPNITQLWIWNLNQFGALRIPSTDPNNWVSILSDGNHYTSVDLLGSLQNANSLGEVSFRDNEITHINITGCTQISQLQLENNKLNTSEVDTILATLDKLGRNIYNTLEQYILRVDISGNAAPSSVGYSHALNLAAKGWKVIAQGWVLEPGEIINAGEARIDFTTNGDSTAMRCDFLGSPIITWNWSDGTTSTGISGANTIKTGLGSGNHNHFIIISNGAVLRRFGAIDGGGNGKLVSISEFKNLPSMQVLYAYKESLLTSIGHTNTTKISKYHLIGTDLSKAAMDQVFADAALSGVINGNISFNNLGTEASDADRATLLTRGWTF